MPACLPESFYDAFAEPAVRGFLHRPQNSNGDAFVLTHGAGSNAAAPLLVALADAFCDTGFTVLRCDLPFRQAHAGPPKFGDNVRDRQGLKRAVECLRLIASGRVFLAGHSYGGRQASILCAEQPDLAAGLLLLSYPLHPPRKPEQMRTQHLPNLRTPCLFVHGTRDPFGTIAELTSAMELVPATKSLLEVEGAGHDLGFTRKGGNAELPGRILEQFKSLWVNWRTTND
jgi:predicted alpha/beta-hydrolase family hydrolase